MSTLFNDLRFAVRLLFRSPVLTIVAAVSLGLGIGANTTIFTLINEVFLAPLPMRDSFRLVSVFTTDERNRRPGGGLGQMLPTSRMNFADYRDQNTVFESLVGQAFTGVSLSSGAGEPEQVGAEIVSGDYFSVLGPPMHLGRGFLPGEDGAPGAAPVTVLTYGLWQRRFGSDTTLVGRTITINRRPFTVVGVTSPAFKGTNALGGPQLWVPFAMYREAATGFMRDNWDSRRALLFAITGRLKPGVTIEQATANLQTIGSSLATAFPDDNRGRSVALVPLARATVNPGFRQNLVRAGALLMTTVGLVLLIACANVANLLLARASGRTQEIAVRLSLGASRVQLVRQLLCESLVLAMVGGAAGLLVALWARSALVAMRPPFLPENALSLPMDARVLGFTALAAVVTGVLFGLAPALQLSKPDLALEIKDRTGQPGSRRRAALRHALVVGQVALSCVALATAGLFLRSLGEARQIAPGFDADKLAVLSFDLTAQGFSAESATERQRQILERVGAVPGVERVTLASVVPLSGGGFARTVFLEGQDTSDPRAGRFVRINSIGDGYFETLGIPRVAGRELADTDRAASPPVVVINQAMARQFWPGEPAIGKRFRFFGQPALIEVVGIVRDSKVNSIGEDPQPLLYQPLRQAPEPAISLQVRAAGDPAAVLATVRGVIQQMEPQMPLVGVFTMENILQQGLWAARMGAMLLGAFGGLALVLATVGVYGVMTYAVSQRQRELGVRLALGATGGGVQMMVLRQGLTLAVVGIAIGVGAGLGVSRLVGGLLYGVSTSDPLTFGAVPAVLLVVATIAIYIPARRASHVDPVEALRAS